jgi:hypothetical protein
MKQMTALTMLKEHGIHLASYNLFDSYPVHFPPMPLRYPGQRRTHQKLSGIYARKMKMAYSLRSVLWWYHTVLI